MIALMEILEHTAEFEICRTSAGHLVVRDRRETAGGRLEIVCRLAQSNALDSLFMPTIETARARVAWLLTHGLARF